MTLKYLTLCLFLTTTFMTYGQTSTVNYTYSNADFVNPERGFYRYSETRSANYTLLDSAELAGYRLLHTPFTAGYSIYSSLVFRYFFLEDFKTGPISQSYLDNMAVDFATARAAGVKIIVRFAYTDAVDDSTCNSWICPPYGDASKAIILEHIDQVKTVLQDNEDVIAAVQMGLIGVWGENYYTDYFGDASQSPFTILSTEWDDRSEVLDSLLRVVPLSRNVQVRYPQIKQKEVYGSAAAVTSAALTLAEAYNDTDKARIGFHNDCFLANFDDYGTYANYDIGSSDTTNLKAYKRADSKYVMVGGETCNLYAGSYCEAEGGMAYGDLSSLHYTYLNAQYNNDVNNEWVGSCMEDVKRNLGYRFYLNSGTYDDTAIAGQSFSYSVELENEGFAATANARLVELKLVNTTTTEEWYAELDHDPRLWFSGTHSIAGDVCLPACMPGGTYDLYLVLADPMESIRRRAEYSIRLANVGLWDSTTGANSLDHQLTVTAGTTQTCATNPTFARAEEENTWIGNSNGDWYSSESNWSLGRFPDFCDKVIISDSWIVTISAGDTGFCKEVELQGTSQLQVLDGGAIEVKK